MKKIFPAIFAFLLGLAPYGQAQTTLTYNNTTNLGWFADDAWVGPATWDPTSVPPYSAILPGVASSTINFTQSTSIGNLTTGVGSAAIVTTLTDASARTLTFSGGTIELGTSIATGGLVSLQGNFTVQASNGSRVLRLFGDSTVAAYSGTATINSGGIEVGNSGNVGSNSNIILTGTGTLQLRNNGTYTLGTMTINSGTLELGRTANINHSATVSQLSGSGGDITVVPRNASTGGTSNLTLNVNQATNTTFEGNINGYAIGTGTDDAFLTFNKDGAGSLTLSGSIDLRRITTVSAGTLLINSSNATFTNGLGTTAIAVNATLGGTGTLEITNGDNVVLGSNGRLQAGLVGSAGQTTFDFSSGGVLNLSDATASANTGWLLFDLGAATTAGTTYDTIALTGTGSLNIGTGLNFSDFNFNLLSGFGAGTYTLFSTTSPITGSFGTTTGTLGGFEATLSFSGNNLLLTVIPEPSAGVLFLSSLATVFLLRRMRRRS